MSTDPEVVLALAGSRGHVNFNLLLAYRSGHDQIQIFDPRLGFSGFCDYAF